MEEKTVLELIEDYVKEKADDKELTEEQLRKQVEANVIALLRVYRREKWKQSIITNRL